ncbi:MAG: ABC transporter ATP-binding protein [Tissierellia bacterium]|nr:ABC transporter ATP-binding protein [Tissierellia bacterium]
MTDQYILQIENVDKSFKNKKALNSFSLKLERGKVLGLLGPNGSGKTTLLKAIMGLVKIDGGQILIDGMKPSVETKAIISYLPDSNYLLDRLSVKEAVDLFKSFYKDFNQDKCDRILKKMNIDYKTKINEMSKGYVERLNVALVMSRDAKLYILDEPIAGVDPLARDMIIDAIIDNIGDATMILTTQLIDSLAKLFDRVCYIDDGKIILEGDTDQLIEEKAMMLEDLYKDLYK